MVFDVADHPTNERSAIALDLYFNALVYANNQGLSLEKTSCLLGIFKATHEKSMAERMTIEKSFGFFKLLALQSSVHRPPYSLGILNFAEMKDMTEYALSTYFRYYKLYQYAFTDLIRMDIRPATPVLETPGANAFESLGVAYPQEEWAEKQKELAEKAAEAKARAEEEAAAIEEAEREALLKAEYEAAIPSEVTTKVQEALAASMEAMREQLEEKFAAQEEALLAKIAALEAK